MQNRLESFIESCANIAIGYAIAIAAQIVIFPLFGLHPTLRENLGIGAAFTGVSLVRSYCLRRLFNRLSVRRAQRRSPEALQAAYARRRAAWHKKIGEVEVKR